MCVGYCWLFVGGVGLVDVGGDCIVVGVDVVV